MNEVLSNVLSSSAGASHVHFVGKHGDCREIVLIAKAVICSAARYKSAQVRVVIVARTYK